LAWAGVDEHADHQRVDRRQGVSDAARQSTSIWRLDGASISPMAVAPAVAVARACSTD
jgi:hypothetical protein